MTYVSPSYSVGIRPLVRRDGLTGGSWNEVLLREQQAKLYGGFDVTRFRKPKVSRSRTVTRCLSHTLHLRSFVYFFGFRVFSSFLSVDYHPRSNDVALVLFLV